MQRDFKGIWIPKEIWFFEGLTITEKVFLSEIDSLDQGAGCFAKNRHFAELFKLSKNRCSEIISSLSEKGFLRTFYEEDNLRRMVLITPFGISNPPSESRLTPSESRLTPSESRQPNNRNIDIHIEIQEREGALFFLMSNYPSKWESFEMKHKKQIPEWNKFLKDFDTTVDIEELPFKDRVLFARLEKYAGNWIYNIGKDKGRVVKLNEANEAHPSRKRIKYS
ncbi:MAG: hypothetical protein CMC13_00340 [Flavobacteriaceae bacterium]|nr:hypothetical protein [Flavobacteriaceae bacterium]|tara:strand:- start:26494 stop:27162 length:669 start_codon:yes stop_codon:yes gene_type:complete